MWRLAMDSLQTSAAWQTTLLELVVYFSWRSMAPRTSACDLTRDQEDGRCSSEDCSRRSGTGSSRCRIGTLRHKDALQHRVAPRYRRRTHELLGSFTRAAQAFVLTIC